MVFKVTMSIYRKKKDIFKHLPHTFYVYYSEPSSNRFHRRRNRGSAMGVCPQDFAVNKAVPFLFLENAPFFKEKRALEVSWPQVRDASYAPERFNYTQKLENSVAFPFASESNK